MADREYRKANRLALRQMRVEDRATNKAEKRSEKIARSDEKYFAGQNISNKMNAPVETPVEVPVETPAKPVDENKEAMKWAGDQSEYGSPGNIEARSQSNNNVLGETADLLTKNGSVYNTGQAVVNAVAAGTKTTFGEINQSVEDANTANVNAAALNTNLVNNLNKTEQEIKATDPPVKTDDRLLFAKAARDKAGNLSMLSEPKGADIYGDGGVYEQWAIAHNAAIGKAYEDALKLWDSNHASTGQVADAQVKELATSADANAGAGVSTGQAADANANVSTLPGGGGTTSNVMNTGEQIYSFDAGLNAENIKRKIAQTAIDDSDDISSLALDDLSIDDYYPTMRKDIAVGTYSGKYLGSATIFAAPGAIAPLGLYNKRKKALADAAKQKQANLEKLLNVPETSAQYQAQYTEAFFNGLEPFLDKHGYNTNTMSTDIDFLRYMGNMQAKAREISKSDEYANSIIESSKDKDQYIPQDMIDVALKVKYNQIDNLAAILRGEKNAVEPFKDAQVYLNLKPQVDDLAKTLLDPARLSESPLNMRTGGKYDEPSFVAERNNFIAKVKSGTYGKDEYASGIVKWFGGSYEQAIEAMAASQNASQDQVENMKKYFAAQMQPKMIMDYKFVSNDALGLANLAERKRQYNTSREDAQNNWWGSTNLMAGDAVNATTKMSYNQALAKLQAEPGLTSAQLSTKMKELAKTYYTNDPVWDPVHKAWISKIAPTAEESARSAVPTSIAGRTMLAKLWIKKDGKFDWVEQNVSLDVLRTTKSKFKIDGKEYDPKEVGGDGETYQASLNDMFKTGAYTRTVSNDVIKGFVNANGQNVYLNQNNLAEYNASNKKKTFVIPQEKLYIVKEHKTPTGTDYKGDTIWETTKEEIPLGGISSVGMVDINTTDGQKYMNNRSGYKPGPATQAVGEGDTYTTSGSSSSQ